MHNKIVGYLDAILYLLMIIINLCSLTVELIRPDRTAFSIVFYILSTLFLVLTLVLSLVAVSKKIGRITKLHLESWTSTFLFAGMVFMLIAGGYIQYFVSKLIVLVLLVLTLVVVFSNHSLEKNLYE